MPSHRPHRPDESEERGFARWPLAAGALALLLGVTVGGYTAGAAVSEMEAVEDRELEISSGILVDPPGGPDEDGPDADGGPLPEDIDPGVAYAVQNSDGDQALDVAGGSTDNGSKIHLWKRHDQSNQQWRFLPVDDSHVEIEGVESSKLLEIDEDSDEEGAVLQERTDEPRQHWLVVEMHNGAVRLVNRESREALGAEDEKVENGSLVVESPDEGKPHQQWQISPPDPEEDSDGNGGDNNGGDTSDDGDDD